MKQCKICQENKSLDSFYKSSKGYYQPYCKLCSIIKSNTKENRHSPEYIQNWRENNPSKHNTHKLRARLKKYSITIQEYNDLLSQQNGKCAVCKIVPMSEQLAIDHCHKTGKVRGLLCKNCNLILGLAQDNPNILRDLADYLEH